MYVEKHHILPKCFKLGGYNDTDNIITLTAKEHFICHLILTKMIDDKKLKSKLSYAAFQMTNINNRSRYVVTAKMYEILKKKLSESYTGMPKSDEHKLALRKPKSTTINMCKPKSVPNWNKGGTVSNTQKQKQSIAMKGKLVGKKNGFYGKTHSEEIKQHLKNINTGKILSKEHKEHISIGLKGKIPWNKGKKATEEHKLNSSKGLTGQIYITDGNINKRIWPENLHQYDLNVWKRGKVRVNFN
jgi:hypothetical protein